MTAFLALYIVLTLCAVLCLCRAAKQIVAPGWRRRVNRRGGKLGRLLKANGG